MSINVFLVLTGKLLPHTSIIPLISKYVIFIFFLNMLTIISTIIIININFRTPRTYRMPILFRRIFLDVLPRYLTIRRPQDNQTNEIDFTSDNVEMDLATRNYEHSNEQKHHTNKVNQFKQFEECTRRVLQDIALQTNAIASQLQHEGRYATVKEEWRMAATVIDRVFLFTTMVVFLAGTFLIMLSSPYLFLNGSKKA
ncbi:hypothetical protein ACOME3_008747 [Neoechinorhynchus agilis]